MRGMDLSHPIARLALVAIAFLLTSIGFFLAIGQPPFEMLGNLVIYAFGDGYSLSESLVKTTPILLCAYAAILPARLGLISVGAEGQLYLGALVGTGVMLALPADAGLGAMLLILAGGVAGGALWALIPAVLRVRMAVNETISTLLLNYVGILLVSHLVYGPWKDPENLGWPATRPFPASATVPDLFGTRVHAGLILACLFGIVGHILLTRSRWAPMLGVMRDNPRLADAVGLNPARAALVMMALGGACAGFAGITEASAIQDRLQPGISVGYGLTGFLVAWLSGHSLLAAIPLSLAIGGLIAAGDALQLFAKVPASSATILQGLLFAVALAVAGVARRRGRAHG